MNDRTYRTHFKPRGISRPIADDEGRYIQIDRTEDGWRDRLLDADPAFREHPNAAVRRIGRTSGLVIRKHPVSLPGLDRIVSQCRADEPMSQGSMKPHDHERDLSPGVRRLHVRGRYHEEIDDPTEHTHKLADGKYMMWPAPRVPTTRTTSHLAYSRFDSLIDHLDDMHGPDLDDPDYADRWLLPHEHPGEMKDPDKSPEKRLDMNPRAADRLKAGGVRRAFFVLEGALKSDALVSEREVAFDVPSVTMWQAPELEQFVGAHLQGVPIYVVCDSDWTWNPQVAVQAFAARDALTEYGAIGQVAAPTPSRSRKPCKHGRPRRACKWCRKRGVDDFIGDGNAVDRMEVVRRELTPAFKDWKWHRLNTADHDLRERKNEVRVIEWMALHAAADGSVAKSAQQIARYTLTAGVKTVWSKRREEFFSACSTDAVHDAVKRLLTGGELSTDDPLAHGDQFVRVRYPDGRLRKVPIHRGEDWALVPDDDLGRKRRLPEFTIRGDLRIEPDTLTIAEHEAGVIRP